MPAGFTAPGILFFGAAEPPERALYHLYYRHLRERYPRLIEPAAGAFASPLVWIDAGGSTGDIDTSDVNLYTSVVGCFLSGGDFDALDVRVDDKKVRLPSTPVKAATMILGK